MNLPIVFALVLAAGLGLILSSVLNTRSVSFADRVASQLRGETLRGKIPSVVRHRRRLRTHERCPFVPGTGLLQVS